MEEGGRQRGVRAGKQDGIRKWGEVGAKEVPAVGHPWAPAEKVLASFFPAAAEGASREGGGRVG